MQSEPYWVPFAKKAMREQGITQNDLLDVFEVGTRAAVGHYFTGRSIINVQQLTLLSRRLGVRLEYCEPKEVKSSLSMDELSKVLDKWLVKFHQLGLAKYNSDVSVLKGLIMSDVLESLPKDQQEKYSDLLKANL